jgi:hypothetical protein
MALRLLAPKIKYGSVVAVVFFHRRGAEGAESDFLFAADPPKKPVDRKDGK